MTATTISNHSASFFPHPNFSSQEEFSGKMIRVSPGQRLNYYLVSVHGEDAGYYQLTKHFNLPLNTDALPVVIMAFIDNQQISLNANLPDEPVFTRIPKGKEVVIPISFTAPTKPGVYTYSVLYQEGPFTKRGNFISQGHGGIKVQAFPDILRLNTTDRIIVEVIP